MNRLFVFVAMIILLWTSTVYGTGQVDTARSIDSPKSMVTDRTLGISFLKIGSAPRRIEKEYRMSLQNPGAKIRLATAGVSVSRRPYVDLSGSYGGKLYLDTPKTRSLLRNRISIDTVDVGGLRFRRELWAVYAGMGMWEGVINCYAFSNRQYYVLSLNVDIPMGKPGETVAGERMNTELLRSRLAKMLGDKQVPAIKTFNELLQSFEVSK